MDKKLKLRKVEQITKSAPRLVKALQRMLDESEGNGVTHGAKVEARSALQAARGTS